MLTFSGTGYAGRPIASVTANIGGLTGATAASVAVTTPGAAASAAVNGKFIVGALVQPTDGSERILTFIEAEDGIKVTLDGQNYDVQFPRPPIAGSVYAPRLVNYPADTALAAYVKGSLRSVGRGYVFSDEWI